MCRFQHLYIQRNLQMLEKNMLNKYVQTTLAGVNEIWLIF